jgi:tripartite-type tricarboxylate transporter receptor subunit TctC
MPDIKKDLQTFGLNVQPSTPEEMAKVMQKEHDQYAAIIKKNHIVVE